MRERDLQIAAVVQDRPQLRDLLALRNRVRGDERDLRIAALRILAGGDEPRRHVVERSAAFQLRRSLHLFALQGGLHLRSHERRIAIDERALFRWNHVVPVDLVRVSAANPRRGTQRDARVVLPERLAQAAVHDVIHHPQRRLGDAGRKLQNFDAVELIDVHHRERRHILHGLPLRAVNFEQHLDLQFAQLPVGDDQEVAAAAGRIEEAHLAQALLEAQQIRPPTPAALRADTLKFRAQLIEEERLDHLEDVLLGRVMSADRAAVVRVHHRLKQRPEDRRRDPRPVEPRRLDQQPAQRRVEVGRSDPLLEEIAVDERERRQIRIQICGAPIFPRVQHRE